MREDMVVQLFLDSHCIANERLKVYPPLWQYPRTFRPNSAPKQLLYLIQDKSRSPKTPIGAPVIINNKHGKCESVPQEVAEIGGKNCGEERESEGKGTRM